MKQIRARILSLILTLALCMSLLPTAALADSFVIPLGSLLDSVAMSDFDSHQDMVYNPDNPDQEHSITPVSYKITFVHNHPTDTSMQQTETVSYSLCSCGMASVRYTVNPLRSAGYLFEGWVLADGKTPFRIDDVTEDITVYGSWSVDPDVRFTVSFDLGGAEGETPAPLTVTPGERLTLPTPELAEGYAFLYWYDTSTSLKWESGTAVTGDLTLRAKFKEPPVTHQVGFDSNGSLDVYLLTEVPHGETLQLPQKDPTRSGYTFLGWYTGTLQEDGTLLNAVKWTEDRVVTEDIILYAMWEKKADVTIRFDLNGAPGEVPETIILKERIFDSMPFDPTWNGYKFLGWYYLIDGKQTDQLFTEQYVSLQNISESIILYAKWEELEDSYWFNNSALYFDDYHCNESYFRFLLNSTDRITLKELLWEMWNDDWGGSCFGMSISYALRRTENLTLDPFQDGAENLRDLNPPVETPGVKSLINYYQLAFRTTAVTTYITDYLYKKVGGNWVEKSQAERYSRIVGDLTDFTVLVFSYGSTPPNLKEVGRSIHAVVAKHTEKQADGWHIAIWNPNNPLKEGELFISSDCKTARFMDGTPNAKVYNANLDLRYAMPIESRASHYDVYNLESLIKNGKLPQAKPSPSGLTELAVNTGSFTLEAADGRKAIVENGRKVSGDLTLLAYDYAAGANDKWYFCINDTDVPGLKLLFNGQDAAFTLASNDFYTKVESDGLGSASVSENSVTTHCDSAAEQKIVLVSDSLGTEWNKLTLTGKDTGFSLAAGKEQVSISSDNAVTAKVVGANVSTNRQSATQAVAVSDKATTVSTAANAMQTAKTNPFTDVSENAYYYDAVLWTAEKGITGGTSATTFSPSNTCTRAQTVTFLWRAAGSPEPTSTVNPFTDVNESNYFYKAVLWAVEKGITGGTSATTFSPNNSCTRAQTVTFLYRSAGAPKTAGSNPFADVGASAYYADAVLWAAEKGITGGTSATTFSPNNSCTRAQIVTFLYRFMK